VPGHFHATVVVGTTLAFMSLTYWLMPVLFRRQIILPGLAKWQPYLFGIGMGVFTLVMMGAGTLGVQRRHWDMTFTDSLLGFDYPASAFTLMGLVGISGVAAIVGGAVFVLITVLSVFFGKRVAPSHRTVRDHPPDAGTGSSTRRVAMLPPASGALLLQAPLSSRCSSWPSS
jgi:cytochrome c oxidase subunit I